MRNLVGQTTRHADAYVEDELTEACIPIGKNLHHGEVQTSLRGECEDYIFTRAWTYWVVTGPVPIDVAWEMYNDPRGAKDVRVAGHCGCPEPAEPWIRKREAGDVVDSYHIDTQDGLNLFAEKVLKTRPLPFTEEKKMTARDIARANRSGRVLYEDDPTEEDYLRAQKIVEEVRSELSHARSRLRGLYFGYELVPKEEGGGRILRDIPQVDRGHTPTDSISLMLSGALDAAIMALYNLQEGDRSFKGSAMGIKALWEDLEANPENYVLRESREKD